FRPHFKTHQSPVIGRWFADEGVDRITVSSVKMAEQFAETGWKNITIAFLLNPLELPLITNLADYLDRQGGRLGLTVDSVASAQATSGLDVDVWIKVDTGYGRTGVRWDRTEYLAEVLAALEKPAGLLTHTGHSYAKRGGAELRELFTETVTRLTTARKSANRPGLKLSVGDTPCCSAVNEFTGIDEIRPGNFVFYDLMQLQIGSCTETQLAAAAVCPVVGLYPERNQIVVHGGSVHLSKESLVQKNGRTIYGQLGTLETPPGERSLELGKILADAPVISLSQEHGVIEVSDGIPEDLTIGDLVVVWPVHSCLTCDLLRSEIVIL
ncbi:MAG: alanine racemase, partial [Candidatus Krumholzibacteria bacterium]|nr:alanine racemase [Candidatus Krumholzibacteria bacterium]